MEDMKLEVGQEVYVPDPNGSPVRGTVLAHGEPDDAETVRIDGEVTEREVAIVRHEDGPSKGFVAKVPYELITAESDA